MSLYRTHSDSLKVRITQGNRKRNESAVQSIMQTLSHDHMTKLNKICLPMYSVSNTHMVVLQTAADYHKGATMKTI